MDPTSLPRAQLRHLLCLRSDEGWPVVWAESLLAEYVEDLSAGMLHFDGSPAELWTWAMGAGGSMGSEGTRLVGHIDRSYRVVVGAFSYGYHPDWLLLPPSPRWGHPLFPAWDSRGRRVV